MRSTFRHQILREPNVEPLRGVCDRDIPAPSRKRSSRFTVGRFGLHRKGRGEEGSGDRIFRFGLAEIPCGLPETGYRKEEDSGCTPPAANVFLGRVAVFFAGCRPLGKSIMSCYFRRLLLAGCARKSRKRKTLVPSALEQEEVGGVTLWEQ